MTGTVVIAERRDAIGEDLDLARRRPELAAVRISAELGEIVVILRDRIGDIAVLPEGLEIRPLDAVAGGLLADDLIKMSKPFQLGPPLGEGVAKAEPSGERGEDVEIIARL